jgi:hypothetical protein
MMVVERRGVGSAVIAAIIVVIVLLAAGTYIALFTSSSTTSVSSNSSSTSASSSSTATATSTSATSTSASSTSTTPTASSTTSSTTNSCSSTGSGQGAASEDFAPLFGNFTAMTMYSYASEAGTVQSVHSNYTVVYASATTYKVSIDSNFTGIGVATTAWVLKNGTLVASSQGGYNFTGNQGKTLYLESMNPFIFEQTYTTLTSAVAGNVGAQVANQSSVTLGPSTVAVSNYAVPKLPETLTACGQNGDITDFAMQAGTTAGSTYPLVTLYWVQETVSANGQVVNVDVLFRVVSLTVA